MRWRWREARLRGRDAVYPCKNSKFGNRIGLAARAIRLCASAVRGKAFIAWKAVDYFVGENREKISNRASSCQAGQCPSAQKNGDPPRKKPRNGPRGTAV